jgi:spore germination cell wall hydrolase CwlJ-like protein
MRKQLLTSTLVIISIILAAPFVALHGKEMISLDGIQYRDLAPTTKKQVDCLADNIYFESGSEPREGKIAVALVTLNRVEKGFSDTICGVVKQKTNNSSGQIVCQFSWWCETRAKNISLSKEKYQKALYQEAQDIAVYVYMNYDNMYDNTKGALFFHANYINPQWKLKRTVTIGRHIFYIP